MDLLMALPMACLMASKRGEMMVPTMGQKRDLGIVDWREGLNSMDSVMASQKLHWMAQLWKKIQMD